MQIKALASGRLHATGMVEPLEPHGSPERADMREQDKIGHQPSETAHQPELFRRMAASVHVDIDTAGTPDDAEVISRAVARCRTCSHTIECEGWLDTGYGLGLPPNFCPNAPMFYLSIAERAERK